MNNKGKNLTNGSITTQNRTNLVQNMNCSFKEINDSIKNDTDFNATNNFSSNLSDNSSKNISFAANFSIENSNFTNEGY